MTAKSFLEDDATFERFPALTLSGPESGPFPFRGVAAVLRGEVAAADLLRPAKGAEGAGEQHGAWVVCQHCCTVPVMASK